MKYKSIRYFLAAIQLLICLSQGIAQPFSIPANSKHAEAVKNGGIYVIMNDKESTEAQKYIKDIQNIWKASKIEFITYKELGNYTQQGNYFLSFWAGETNYNMPGGGGTTSVTGVKHGLSIWTFRDSYLKSNKFKSFTEKDYIFWLDRYSEVLANIPLCVSKKLFSSQLETYKMDFSGNGLIYNWGEGIFLNYIKYLQNSFNTTVPALPSPQKLKKDTLYIPAIATVDYGIGMKPKQEPVTAEMLKEYRFPYKIISLDELNAKLLKEGRDFNYLAFYIGAVEVLNSKNAGVLYSSRNFKQKSSTDVQKHFEWLNEAVEGK